MSSLATFHCVPGVPGDYVAIELSVPFREAVQAEPLLGYCTAVPAHSASQGWRGQEFAETRGQSAHVTRGKQVAGLGVSDAVGDAAHGVGEYGTAHGLGLQNHPGQAFMVVGGESDNRAAGVPIPQFHETQYSKEISPVAHVLA